MRVGQFLATLTPEEEGRVLGRKMVPRFLISVPSRPEACLIGTAYGLIAYGGWPASKVNTAMENHVGENYNELCDRFTPERVNNAIRGRVLRNKLLRELATVRKGVSV